MTAPVGRPCEASPPRIAAAILAGGAASRFNGLPKGLLRLPSGSSMIERTIAVLLDAGFGEITIFANDPAPYQGLGREIVPDHRPGHGPLGGIETALLHYRGRCEAVLVLPCDLPGITARELTMLIQAFAEHSRPTRPVVVAETDACPERPSGPRGGPSGSRRGSRRSGFWQPLCAVVSAEALAAVSQALDEGRRGVYRLWRELAALPVPFPDPAPFFNLNTPADLARWLACREGIPFDGACRAAMPSASQKQEASPPPAR